MFKLGDRKMYHFFLIYFSLVDSLISAIRIKKKKKMQYLTIFVYLSVEIAKK